MIGTSLEQSKDSIKKLEATDNETASFVEGFTKMTAKSKEAIDNCRNIEKSAVAIEESQEGIDRVVLVLEKIVPNLIL